MVVTGNTTLSLTMLQNVFCWGALCDKQWVKSEEKTKRLSVAGAAKGIEFFFGGVLQVSILLKKYWSEDFKSNKNEKFKTIFDNRFFISIGFFVYKWNDWKNSSYAAYEEGNLEQTNIKVYPLW